MATKRVYDSKTGLYKVIKGNGSNNTTTSSSGGGSSLVAGANALSNATNKNSGGRSDSPSNSGMSLFEGASALSNATNKNSSNSGTSLGGSGNSQYTGVGTHNDSKVSEYAKKEIQYWKDQYNIALAAGNENGMKQAHAEAEAIRKRYGYSGGDDGSERILLEQGEPEYEFDEEQPTQPQRDPRIDALLNEILNREDFSYDVMNDPLYQQYAKMYQREGDRAMKETMAEAAAGAGGMNTYAITAAQQANSYYNSQLNDKVPELYQLAYEMYLADKESKVQDLGLLQNMDATQYARYRDTMSDWRDDRDFAYGMYRDDVADKQWQTTFDYNDYWANKNFDYNDAWKTKDWNATQDQIALENSRYDRKEAEEKLRLLIAEGITPDATLIEQAGWTQAEVDSLVAAVLAEKNAMATGGSKSSGKGGTDYTGKPGNEPLGGRVIPTSNITDEIKNKAASFASNTALASYLNGLVSSNTITQPESDSLYAQFVDDNEKYIKGADDTLNISYGDMIGSTAGWEVVDNGGVNWGWGIDNNAIIKAPNGEQMRLDNLLQKLIAEGMDNAKAKDAIIALQKNLNF